MLFYGTMQKISDVKQKVLQTMMLFKNFFCKMKVLKDNGKFKTNALQENVTLHKTNTLQDAK